MSMADPSPRTRGPSRERMAKSSLGDCPYGPPLLRLARTVL